MKKMLSVLICVVLLSSCQTFRDSQDMNWSNLPDPGTVEESKEFTLELIKLKGELELAKREQDFVRRMQVLDKIVELVKDYVKEESLNTVLP